MATMEFEGQSVRVGYNKVFGAVLIGLGALCFALGALAALTPSMLVGAMNILIGTLYFMRPYFVLTPHAIELRNLLGMTLRSYTFDDLRALEVSPDGKQVHQVAGGQRSRLKLTSWLADGRDWRRFVAIVQARAFE